MATAKRDLYMGLVKARNAGDEITDEELERFPEWKDGVEETEAPEVKADEEK